MHFVISSYGKSDLFGTLLWFTGAIIYLFALYRNYKNELNDSKNLRLKVTKDGLSIIRGDLDTFVNWLSISKIVFKSNKALHITTENGEMFNLNLYDDIPLIKEEIEKYHVVEVKRNFVNF